ncbi:UNVERIFIED_CONTAM: hypothetical protein Sindi_2669000 [Sesamum indicum]
MEVTRADLSDLQELEESFPNSGLWIWSISKQMKLLHHYHCRRETKGKSRGNPKSVLENTPWARTMLQPLHPYGVILNLDIIDFRNTEKLIDEWVTTIKIAATSLELDKENFIKLVELSLEGSVKMRWDNTPEYSKASILVEDSKGAIADRLGRPIKIHFIGDGYFEGSRA